MPLGLLAEEVDTESEPDEGSKLTHTTSHPPIGSLMRTATLPAHYDHSGAGNGREHLGDHTPPPQPGLMRGRTFESAFQNLSLGESSPKNEYLTVTEHYLTAFDRQNNRIVVLSGRATLAGTMCPT